jgi:hypothetical protein
MEEAFFKAIEPADEDAPFDNKYKARDIYESLMR